jgi:threonine dehydratase
MSAPISSDAFTRAHERVAAHAHRTPLLGSATLSEVTGFDVRLKAELFQRTGSYKLRGPLNKLLDLSPESRERGVVCSSAGNHAQGLALAARTYGIAATVVMASNATVSKIEATKHYGAEVVLHGNIWDEANAKALQMADDEGLTYVHPFDDPALVAGQGTVGREIVEDWPDVDAIVVPIGGGGLISGVALAAKQMNPAIRIIGVESSGGPAMKTSVDAGHLVTLEEIDTVVDGLRVKRVGDFTFSVVCEWVDEIVVLPDPQIFEAVLWTMRHTKLVAEGAAAATVGALLNKLVALPADSKVVCVLSGGNLDLSKLAGMSWN